MKVKIGLCLVSVSRWKLEKFGLDRVAGIYGREGKRAEFSDYLGRK